MERNTYAEVCESRDFDREVEKIFGLISQLEDKLTPVLIGRDEGLKSGNVPQAPKSPVMNTLENIQSVLETLNNRVNI